MIVLIIKFQDIDNILANTKLLSIGEEESIY